MPTLATFFSFVYYIAIPSKGRTCCQHRVPWSTLFDPFTLYICCLIGAGSLPNFNTRLCYLGRVFLWDNEAMDLIGIVLVVGLWVLSMYLFVLWALYTLGRIRTWFNAKMARMGRPVRSQGKKMPIPNRRVKIMVNRRDVWSFLYWMYGALGGCNNSPIEIQTLLGSTVPLVIGLHARESSTKSPIHSILLIPYCLRGATNDVRTIISAFA